MAAGTLPIGATCMACLPPPPEQRQIAVARQSGNFCTATKWIVHLASGNPFVAPGRSQEIEREQVREIM